MGYNHKDSKILGIFCGYDRKFCRDAYMRLETVVLWKVEMWKCDRPELITLTLSTFRTQQFIILLAL